MRLPVINTGHHDVMRLLTLFVAALLTFVVCAPAPAQAPGMPVFPGSSVIGLVPPEGMTPSRTFAGFEHSSGASIVLVDLPAEAYDALAGRFTPDGLRPIGFVMRGDSVLLSIAGGEGMLARGYQEAHGVRFRKWIAILRGPAVTGMVTVQIPEGEAGISDAAVEATLQTIAFRPAQSMEDQIAALPYAVGDLAGFRIVRGLLGNSLLLTDGPKDIDPEGDQPMVVVAHSLGAAWTAGQDVAFARKAAAGIAGLEEIAITSERQSESASTIIVRLRGHGRDASNGQPRLFAQTILFHGSDYIRVIAITPPERAEALDRAERLAGSISMHGPSPTDDASGHR
jgi:hypothetical protein